MLPGIDGLEVCRLLKNDVRTDQIPIVMLTAKGEESDIIKGLEYGADDYVTKPFSPKILVARAKAVLRRRSAGGISDGEVISHSVLFLIHFQVLSLWLMVTDLMEFMFLLMEVGP